MCEDSDADGAPDFFENCVHSIENDAGSAEPLIVEADGVVSLAILGIATFDTTLIESTSVTTASAPARLKGKGKPCFQINDVNSDGFDDIVVQVHTNALELSSASLQLRLPPALTEPRR